MIYKGGSFIDNALLSGVPAWGVFAGGVLVWKRDPITVQIDNSGNLDIPAYARFIDFVLIGGGASGQTGSGAVGTIGRGGEAGYWLGVTLQRGVDVPWSTVVAAITVGAGGPRAEDHDMAAPSPGGASGVSLAGTSAIIASGGDGTRAEAQQSGMDAGNYTYNGKVYVGGTGGNTTVREGQPPGAGGCGGAGGAFGNRTQGWAGGKGRVWATFRSF